jgi:hypothetical protein
MVNLDIEFNNFTFFLRTECPDTIFYFGDYFPFKYSKSILGDKNNMILAMPKGM